MKTIWQDARYGLRMLFRHKSFTIVSVLSLALGMGVNTTIFSFVNAVLFRPLPFPGAEQLVRVWGGNASSYPNYAAYRDQSRVFEGLAAYARISLSLTNGTETERIWGDIVTGNFFDVLASPPVQGRGFLPEEDRTAGTHPVVVISHRLWQSRFNGDLGTVGKNIVISGQSFTIVGITAENFRGPELRSQPELWVPMMCAPLVQPGSISLTAPDSGWLNIIGRLKTGVSLAQAQAMIATTAARLNEERRARDPGPEDPGRGSVEVVPARGLMVAPQRRTPTWSVFGLLMMVVMLVLLVACANVANMLLARAVTRRKEIAVRLAVGASRWRVVRQLLTESLMLALLGGAAGMALSWWTADLLESFLPQTAVGVRGNLDTSPDVRVFAYTLLLSLVTAVLFGLIPALQGSRPSLVSALKDERLGFSHRRLSLRNLLVVTQVTVSLLLLFSAGLFIRNLRNTQHADPGFQIKNGFVMTYDLGHARYNPARGELFHQDLLGRVRALPGVSAASLAEYVPLGGGGTKTALHVAGEAPSSQLGDDATLSSATITTDYFKTMGIPLVRGRDFNQSDAPSAPQVVIVNQTLARRLAPDGNAIGKQIRMDSQGDKLEVVGVVQDIKYRELTEGPTFFAYRPLGQSYRPLMTLHVRTLGDLQLVMNQVRAEARTLDGSLPVTNVETLQEHMRLTLDPARLFALLSTSFGVLALLLAATGLYGVMAYLVSGRTHEFGIRLALGARSNDLQRIVLAEGLMLVGVGLFCGLLASIGITRVLQSVLYGVSATDPLTFAGVALVLTVVALLACYLPARRATKVDPLVALRYE